MSNTLAQVLSFGTLAPGVSATLPHTINVSGTSYVPDKATPSNGNFAAGMIVTATDVTVTNNGGVPAACDVLLELYHTTSRALGALTSNNLNQGMTPRPFVPGANGGADDGARQSIVWDVGGGGDAETWAEVMVFIEASKAPIDVFVASDVTIPPGTYETNYVRFIGQPPYGGFSVSLDDGAVIRNPRGILGQLGLISNSTGSASVEIDPASGGGPGVFTLEGNGVLISAGTAPMIKISAGTAMVLTCLFGSEVQVPGSPAFDIGAGAIFIVGVYGPASLPDGFVQGDPTGTLLYQNLNSAPTPLPTTAAFAGTTIQNVLMGASCVDTATRPANPFGSLLIGTMVFDQALGRPIWWSGTQWVDATGAPA